jgi:hypothetical protein
LIRTGGSEGDERTYSISVSFVDKQSRDDYQSRLLPEIKKQTKIVWKGFLAPAEVLVD